MEAEDALVTWIDENFVRDANAWERTTTLYAAWSAWCHKTGEYAGNMKRFSQTLEMRGATHGVTYQRHHKNGRGFRGLRLVGDANAYCHAGS